MQGTRQKTRKCSACQRFLVLYRQDGRTGKIGPPAMRSPIMKSSRAIAAVLTSAVLAAAFLSLADAKDEFLPPEQAFRYLARVEGDCLKVHWNVAPGHYLYKHRMGLESATPSVALGEPRYPKGESHEDEYFGRQEIFRDDFIVTAPLIRKGNGPRELTLKLKWQGCADAGLCYPPIVW